MIDYFSHPTELKGLGADFVFGFVQSVDGERDPRNLLLAFQIARKIIHGGYDLGENTHIVIPNFTNVFYVPFFSCVVILCFNVAQVYWALSELVTHPSSFNCFLSNEVKACCIH